MTITLNTAGQQPAGSGEPVLLAAGSGAGPQGVPLTIPVPDVVGAAEADAVKILEGFGFSVVDVRVPGPGTQGEVYGQQPRPDDLARRGSPVRIFVISAGPEDADSKRFDGIDQALDQLGQAVGYLIKQAEGLETESAAQERFEKLAELIASAGSAPPKRPTST